MKNADIIRIHHHFDSAGSVGWFCAFHERHAVLGPELEVSCEALERDVH